MNNMKALAHKLVAPYVEDSQGPFEASRQPAISGGEGSRHIAPGSVAVSRYGEILGCRGDGWVGLYAYESDKPKPELPNDCGPYTIIYTPKEES